MQAEPGRGDDRERSLAAAQQSGQVEAGVVLLQIRRGAGSPDRRRARPRCRRAGGASVRSAARARHPRSWRRFRRRSRPRGRRGRLRTANPRRRACVCNRASVTPACAVTWPVRGSTGPISSRRRRSRTSSPCSGTDPPTRPVFPPCGTTAVPAVRAQTHDRRRPRRRCPGRTTAAVAPRNRPVQSTTFAATTSGSVRTCAAPTTSRSAASRSGEADIAAMLGRLRRRAGSPEEPALTPGVPRSVSCPSRQSLRGRLLVAAPPLVDPNFDRTVVLMLEHGDDGGLGIVLNRPSETTVERRVPRMARARVAARGRVRPAARSSTDAVIALARRRRAATSKASCRSSTTSAPIDLADDPARARRIARSRCACSRATRVGRRDSSKTSSPKARGSS